MLRFVPEGMGWIPDLPDSRDFTLQHPEVLPLLRRLPQSEDRRIPDSVDLRADSEGQYFLPPEQQGALNSSTSFAVLSLLEYFERRVHGRIYEGSKLFLYRVTRNLISRQTTEPGDAGADLRTTFKALCTIGVPMECFWPYDVSSFSKEPSAFHYAIARPLRHLRYFRLDEPNSNGDATWVKLQSFLAAGFPVVFGLPVPTSLTSDARIPYRPERDGWRGAQAVVAVGYKSNFFGKQKDAVLIRSSWGSQWGDNGNGWLPAAYVRNQVASSFWTAISETWLSSRELSVPAVIASQSY